MDLVIDLVVLLSVVAAVAALAKRFGLLGPVLMVVAGIVLSFVPGFPEVELDPELVLAGVIPPLLYVTALETSVPDFRRNLRPILLLAVGLVLFTTLCVGFALHAVVPELSLPVCFALGAIVSPPDAVSATAVANRIGLPRRVVTILEGEALLNDATALVTLRVAVAAVTGAAATWPEAAMQFVLVSVGGLVVGFVVGRALEWLFRRTTQTLLDNTLSLLAPFVAFVVAEELDVSGIVAVVVCGLMLGHAQGIMSAASRLQTGAFWNVVKFLLEGVIFLVLGLQMRGLLEDLDTPAGEVAATSVVVLLTVVVSRFVGVFASTYIPRLVPSIRERDPYPPVSFPIVVSWAGMRGAISLAAAASLPADIEMRPLLLWVTFVVILGTLVGQGLTLAPLARWLKVPPDDLTELALAEASVQYEATQAGLAALEEIAPTLPPEIVEELRYKAELRANAAWEQLGRQDREPPSAARRRARRAMIQAERDVFTQARDEGRLPEPVLVRVQRQLDLEESQLGRD